MATKEELIAWHRSQLGFVEGPRNNETKYASLAGHANFLAWCATYQVAGARAVGLVLPSESAWTPSMLQGLRSAGREIDGPEVGAFGFLYFASLSRVAHVVFVESVRSDGRFVTIEGNTDVAGGRTGGRVMRKVRSRSGFTFAMPEYDEKTITKTEVITTPVKRVSAGPLQRAVRTTADGIWGPITDKRCRSVIEASAFGGTDFPYGVAFTQKVVGTRPDNKWGPNSTKAHKATVKNMQLALKTMGFNPGTADGIWGPNTNHAFVLARNTCRR